MNIFLQPIFIMNQIQAASIASRQDIILQLQRKPFGARSSMHQKIPSLPRAKPKLNIKAKRRVFQEEWYEKKEWLCGSEGKGAFLCLLFKRGALQTCLVKLVLN